mmetsp:Transcript_14646/g.14730  ORF Transcript_14646/g.14730 Transcript_14646/m.14730 type:complete len:450 (-) Transcript_14646:24-1373(-)
MVSVVRVSKFRHVFGEELQEKFEDLRPSTLSSESSLIKSNGTNIVFPWESGGAGVLAVFAMSEIGRIAPSHPFIKGHVGNILDYEFNPFNDFQLLSCGDDATLKLWDIPEGGLTADITVPRVSLSGHGKKVSLINFHPSAAFLCASASFDKTIKVWNIENGSPELEISNINEIILSLQWSPIGRMIGYTTRDKYAKVSDPRTGRNVMEVLAHEGSKPSKMGWIDEDTIVTCGFSKMNDRQLSIWDLRNSQKIKTINIDQGSGVLYPFYDPDTKILFVAGKGDGNIRYYEIVGDDQYMYYVEAFRSNIPCRGISFIPKRKVDADACEIMKAVKLTNNTVDLVSFKVPRRVESFQDDIYPDCISGEPAMGSSEWLSGTDREPRRAPIKQIDSSPTRVELHVQPHSPAPVQQGQKSVKDYEKELNEARATIKMQQQRIAELEAQLESKTKLE